MNPKMFIVILGSIALAICSDEKKHTLWSQAGFGILPGSTLNSE
jgi:hypothetical protein